MKCLYSTGGVRWWLVAKFWDSKIFVFSKNFSILKETCYIIVKWPHTHIYTPSHEKMYRKTVKRMVWENLWLCERRRVAFNLLLEALCTAQMFTIFTSLGIWEKHMRSACGEAWLMATLQLVEKEFLSSITYPWLIYCNMKKKIHVMSPYKRKWWKAKQR